jgi:hypothetical protein
MHRFQTNKKAAQQTMRGLGPLKRLATLNPKKDILFVKTPQGQHHEEERARASAKCIDSRQTKKPHTKRCAASGHPIA